MIPHTPSEEYVSGTLFTEQKDSYRTLCLGHECPEHIGRILDGFIKKLSKAQTCETYAESYTVLLLV